MTHQQVSKSRLVTLIETDDMHRRVSTLFMIQDTANKNGDGSDYMY